MKLLETPLFGARALLLGARIDTRNWPAAETLARAPLAIRLSPQGVAVLFRYGVAVLLGAGDAPEQTLLARLVPLIEHPYPEPEFEELDVRIEPGEPEGLHEGALWVRSGNLETLQLVAEALSKSVLLAHYETRLVGDFDRIEPLALQLGRDGRIGGGTREHVRRIGTLLLIEQRMVGRAEIGDKPEVLWDHPELERLNALIEDEFEIHERLAALDRKLELVARTERTLIDLISARHSLRVEWYIVGLIVVEILLSLYGMWLH